ncbi:hypothetical protein L3X38_017478 [Prunus dulcis]|uniref:RNase H type-1 domain-containing protein n=1 Tax=Prunus dulcis TaxID=3755 RepID=A0AAD4W9W9_PRUDU|nr:hypothetical protein L3X38_017478 [Prunus dulcis]
MHVRCIIRLIPGVLSHTTRYRGTPTPNQSHSLDEVTFHSEGNTKSDRQSSSPQPIPQKSADKCRPFFKALKKGQKDKWDEEYEVTLQSLTTYLTSPPLLSKPIPATHEGGNRAKLIQPLLPAEDCNKSQALADFVAEFTPSAEEEKLVSKKKESSRADKTSAEPDQPRDMWQLRVAGALNQKGAGAGVIIVTPDGTLLEQAITVIFLASNNEAEYEALLAGLCLAKELSIKKLAIYSDS